MNKKSIGNTLLTLSDVSLNACKHTAIGYGIAIGGVALLGLSFKGLGKLLSK